ncbi:MAG: hypothetical protein WDN67_05520 [Candidatus Moraniibacteriota bacterium]
MYFVGIEDLSGRVEILVFGRTAENTGDSWKEDEIALVSVRVSHKEGQLRVIAESVERINDETLTAFSRADHARSEAARTREERDTVLAAVNDAILVSVEDQSDAPTKTIEQLSRALEALPKGPARVKVALQGMTIETNFSIRKSPETLAQIAALDALLP